MAPLVCHQSCAYSKRPWGVVRSLSAQVKKHDTPAGYNYPVPAAVTVLALQSVPEGEAPHSWLWTPNRWIHDTTPPYGTVNHIYRNKLTNTRCQHLASLQPCACTSLTKVILEHPCVILEERFMTYLASQLSWCKLELDLIRSQRIWYRVHVDPSDYMTSLFLTEYSVSTQTVCSGWASPAVGKNTWNKIQFKAELMEISNLIKVVLMHTFPRLGEV